MFMHLLASEYLDARRFDGTLAATLRTLCECQGQQQPYAAQSAEAFKGPCDSAALVRIESSSRLKGGGGVRGAKRKRITACTSGSTAVLAIGHKMDK